MAVRFKFVSFASFGNSAHKLTDRLVESSMTNRIDRFRELITIIVMKYVRSMNRTGGDRFMEYFHNGLKGGNIGYERNRSI